MPVFHCAHCGQPIDADETLAGVNVGCPACLHVVQVPAPAPSQNYQPYQPPVFVQPPNRRSPHAEPYSAEPYSAEPDKWRIKAPALGTAAAFVLCLLKKLSEPTSSLDVALGNTGFVSSFAGGIGYTLAAGIFALVIALVIAGIAAACQKSFLTVLTRSYGIGAVLASLLMIAGPMLQPRNVHSASPSPPSRTSANTREELNKLQADMERMREGVMPANDASPAKPQTSPADATDDAGKLVLITRQYFEEIAALQKGYADELARIGFMRLLDRNRVMADTGFTESYDMLARARVLLRKQGVKMRESLASLPAKIRASNISPAAREDYALSAEQGTPRAMTTFDEGWSLEESIINEMENVIDLLSKRRGRWQVSNNQFLFYDGSDLAVFNAAMDKISAASAQQNEIRQQGQQKTGKMFDDLRSALPK